MDQTEYVKQLREEIAYGHSEATKEYLALVRDYHATPQNRPVIEIVKSRSALYDKLAAGFVCTSRGYTAHFSMNEQTASSAAGAWALWGPKSTKAVVTADSPQLIAEAMDKVAPFELWDFE